MKTSFKIFSIILFISSPIFSQQYSPGSTEWLVDMFFSQSEFPDKANYLTGEMLNFTDDATIGEELAGKAIVNFHQIKTAESEAVFKIEVEQDKKIIDFYCFLSKQDNKWTINAVRRFLLPAFLYTVRDSLSQLSTLSSNDSTLFKTLKLFTASDEELMQYLETNLKNFRELVSAFDNNIKDEINKYLALVGCNAIYADAKYPSCIFIQIQRFENMECGFIYTTESAILPEISLKDFIYLEEVNKNWYIYRVM